MVGLSQIIEIKYCISEAKMCIIRHMKHRTRYTNAKVSRSRALAMRRKFLKDAGPAMKLMIELMESLPNVAFVLKNAEGRIMHMNKYNMIMSGWRTIDEVLGYHSEELYPPDQAAVYAGRDREVMESGKPIIERVYGFVADRSTNLNCVTVRPVNAPNGRRIGTATVYWRAQRKLATANWYDPIRGAIVYLNEHYSENISIPKLAKMANYSVSRFRRLFESLTQQSPAAYVMNVRLSAAKTLLSTTDRRITDIAVETGFFDHSHFIRSFRAATGTTPGKFRRDSAGRHGRALCS